MIGFLPGWKAIRLGGGLHGVIAGGISMLIVDVRITMGRWNVMKTGHGAATRTLVTSIALEQVGGHSGTFGMTLAITLGGIRHIMCGSK
jgi:hypothetical protein